MQKIILKNNIPLVVKTNKNTPRIALSFYFTITNPEKKAGINTLLNRLFMQGTKNRTSEQLAQELEENAIEMYSEMKHDYIRFKILCLNEDFNLALEILEDVIKNSHFELFDKELVKLKGEIEAELDSPKTKALDNFYKTLYEGHYYGNTYTKILENINSLDRQDILNAYQQLINLSKKNICIVGDIEPAIAQSSVERHFSDLSNDNNQTGELNNPTLQKNKIITIEKEDASQAQIIQGWLFPSLHSEEYPAIILINTILGSSGLSSRLFLELREKQGLAYVVRSSYEAYKLAASFSVYIATEPQNIKTCLLGFTKEIEKIKNELVSDDELEAAKNNVIGKRQFFTETNILQASLIGLYESEDLGYDYEEKLIKAIKSVTKEQLNKTANAYFNTPKVLSVLAPKEYLSLIEDSII